MAVATDKMSESRRPSPPGSGHIFVVNNCAHLERENNKLRDLCGNMQNLLCDPPVMIPRPKPVPSYVRNFSMENRRHLKNLSEARELKLAQKSVEMPIKCSNKYADVQSKFYRDMEFRCGSGQVLQKDNFLRAHSKTDPLFATRKVTSSHSASSASSPRTFDGILPSSSALGCRDNPSRNYVKQNGNAAKFAKAKSTARVNTRHTPQHARMMHKTGEVPQYIVDRNEEWEMAKEKAREDKERAKLPKGCRLMDEEQRRTILEELKRIRSAKEHEMFHLPVRSDTLRIRTKRQELENALQKLDEQLEILSKPKVYIPISDDTDTFDTTLSPLAP